MASCLLWGLWGLFQSCLSTIEFDFAAFGKWRITDGYYYFKRLEMENV